MNNFHKIFYFIAIFSGLNIAQTYLTIHSGNSLFIPIGSQVCADYIDIETGASYISEDPSGTCEGAVVTGDGDIVFPIELISFTAEIFEKGYVLLKWETSTEVNNFGFEVERSNSNEFRFEKIGFVSGHGNSNSKLNYSFIDTLPLSGMNHYRLKQINIDGSFSFFNIVGVIVSVPKQYFLSQNYPNPFNPSTKIYYEIPINGFVTLKVYDVLGNELITLINEEQLAGRYEFTFNPSNLSSGIYFYQVRVGNYSATKKMILMQ